MSDLILDLSFFPNFDSSPPFMSLLYIRHHKLLNPISKIFSCRIFFFGQWKYAPCECTKESFYTYKCICKVYIPWMCVSVWGRGTEAKVNSALARLSGWMESIRISRDCSGICRRI